MTTLSIHGDKMKTMKKSNAGKPIYLVFAYLIMLVVLFLLPYYSAPGYSILHNTSSELGAQYTPNAWVMNLTFILLGLGSIVSGWNYLKGYWLARILLVLFGMSLVLTAYFHHMPIDGTLTYSVQEDNLHSLFASTTGFSFIAFAFTMAIVLPRKSAKWMAMVVGIAASLLSLLMFSVPEYMGVWQRIMFVISFGWMIGIFSNRLEK